jgi:hypothetical protein
VNPAGAEEGLRTESVDRTHRPSLKTYAVAAWRGGVAGDAMFRTAGRRAACRMASAILQAAKEEVIGEKMARWRPSTGDRKEG